jgi:ribosomal protein S27AE
VGHPKRPGIIDAKITAEYVTCGVCLTKNRIASHKKTLRPVCGRCGYPLPDPFGAQPRIRSLAEWGEWIIQYRRAFAAITGSLLVMLFVWLVGVREGPFSSLPTPAPQQSHTARIDYPEAPVYAVAVVVHRDTSTDTDDERDDLPPRSLPSPKESPSDGLYGLEVPKGQTWTKSESVVIVIDVCGGRAQEHFQAGSDHPGDLPGVLVSSSLQQMNGDPSDPLVSPHLVEQIYIQTAPDPRG